MTRYRITVIEWEAMLAAQGGLCAICRQPMRRPVTDHDHASGKVRGILCHPCNIKLHALDSWPHHDAAIQYLAARGAACAS